MTINIYDLLCSNSLEKISEEEFKKRILAFDNFFKEQKYLDGVFDLIRFIYSLPLTNNSIENLKNNLIKTDPNFPKTPKPFHLKFLSFAALCFFINNNSSIDRDISVLAAVNCFGFGLRSKPERFGMVDTCEKMFRFCASQKRIISNITPIDLSFSLKDEKLNEIINDIQLVNTPDFPKTIQNDLNKITTLFNKLVESINFSSQVNTMSNKVQQEEIDILWWVFGNFSKEFNITWSSINLLKGCLFIGKEFSDLVNIIPGPISAEEIIKKIVSTSNHAEVHEATLSLILTKITKEQKISIVTEFDSFISDLTPIHFALKARITLKNLECSQLLNNHNINIDISLPIEIFSLQFYRERLFLKAMKNITK